MYKVAQPKQREHREAISFILCILSERNVQSSNKCCDTNAVENCSQCFKSQDLGPGLGSQRLRSAISRHDRPSNGGSARHSLSLCSSSGIVFFPLCSLVSLCICNFNSISLPIPVPVPPLLRTIPCGQADPYVLDLRGPSVRLARCRQHIAHHERRKTRL